MDIAADAETVEEEVKEVPAVMQDLVAEKGENGRSPGAKPSPESKKLPDGVLLLLKMSTEYALLNNIPMLISTLMGVNFEGYPFD